MEKHPLLQIGPQADILALKVPACGLPGQRVAPERSGVTSSRCGEARRGQIPKSGDTNRLPASHHHQSCDFTHTSCGNHAFFKVCPISYPYTLPRFVMRFSHTQTDPERKLCVFSDDGYVFTIQ
ncbi:unnamed protein product [Pipistrellus nathusii]|uniref:Uncharacterized protein n=1 Tax=Pipistrellus nathusii TaxID=59473 RepID=A0ABP0A2A4_PIPNA